MAALTPLRVRLRARLEILHPGDRLEALCALAQWKAHSGLQRRLVREWRYNRATDLLTLPRGLWPLPAALGPFAKPVDERLVLPPARFLPRWSGPKLEPVQQRAFAAMRRAGGGLLEAPGGSGKTVMALHIIAAWGQPALWIVHSAQLVGQAMGQARRLFALPPGAIGTAIDGAYRPGSLLTFATRQTLASRMPRGFAERFGTVWVDEIDLAGAPTYMRLVQRFPALHRGGGTATVARTDRLHPAVLAVFGPVAATITEAAAEDAGLFVSPIIEFRWTGQSYEWPGDWPTLQAERARDPQRNDIIARAVARDIRDGHSVLVLCQMIDHAEAITAILRRHGYDARHVTGQVERDTRDRRISDARSRRLRCIVATRVLERGTDLPVVDRVHMADPYRSWPTVMQQVYRASRPAEDKEQPVVIDWCDGGRQFESQAWARLRLYRDRQWETRGRVPVRPR
jgi:superfamily II DNA or RNA helicase